MPVSLALLVVFALLPVGCNDPNRRQPNIQSVVLIGVDTLRADHLGLYGSERPTSPTLDRVAEQARVFERAYATSAWTLPSFASLLTGLDPAEHGTGILLRRTSETERDEKRIGPKERTKMDPSVRTLAERLSANGFATLAVVQTPNLDPIYEVDRGFDIYAYSPHGRSRRADRAVAKALNLVRDHRNEPFFLFLHLIDPHLSYDAPEPIGGRFTNDIDTDADFEMPRTNILQLRRAYRKYSATEKEFVAAAYDEEVLYIDHQIARFLEGLSELGLAEETLFVLTSDHGEEFFEHGSFEHGHSLHAEVVHVPFLVWGPGIAPGRESNPISIADAAPTILEAVGLENPESGFGQSLWPALRGGQPVEDDRLIVAAGTIYGPEQQMAIRWPYKLIQHPSTGDSVLFNLEDDPEEENDLSRSRSQLTRQLAAELDHQLDSSGKVTQREGAKPDDELIENLRELGYVE